MAQRRIAARIVSGLFFAVVCLAMFDLPSAYVIARGWPVWLALTLGLLTFPVVPLGWHAWGERARKRRLAAAKTPPKAVTTGWERLALRGGTVGVLAIGLLLVADRGGTWTAVKHHALWVLPDRASMIDPDAEILSHLPPDTEAVIWLRPSPELRESLGAIVPQLADPPEAVIAIGGASTDDFAGVVLERGSSDLIGSIEKLLDLTKAWGVIVPPERTTSTLSDGTRTWTTKGWTTSLDRGKPAALLEMMKKVPDDAFTVAVVRPAHVIPNEVTSAVAYAHLADHATKLELVAEIEAADAATAGKLAAEARREIDKERKHEDRESGCLDSSGATWSFTPDGANIHLRFAIAVERIRPLFECLDAH